MICSGVGSAGAGSTLATSYSGLPLKNSSIHSCISFTGIRLRKREDEEKTLISMISLPTISPNQHIGMISEGSCDTED